MGVVNVTPDSFSDGGRFHDEAAAVSHALQLLADGADILDVGGESTRPGAEPVGEAEEIARVVPVIQAVRRERDAPISIDTMKPAVARAAVAAGAAIWNDVSALQGQGGLETAAELGCTVVLMHMRGDPRTMQQDPRYDDVVREVAEFLSARAEAATAAGVARDRIWVDPGIGFGKTVEHNLALLANLDRIATLGFPVVLGVSRKRFIATLEGRDSEAGAERVGGSLAAALEGADRGAAVLRVHDVRATVQALKVRAAIRDVR
jgi:dihydropteroate synthase